MEMVNDSDGDSNNDTNDNDSNSNDPFQKNGSFLFLSYSCFKIGQTFMLNVSLGIHL